MNPPDLKSIVKAGMTRAYHDGVNRPWRRKAVEGIIRPRGFANNSLDDPEIQQMFKELEEEGFIKLYYEDDRYLEVIGVKPLDWGQPGSDES